MAIVVGVRFRTAGKIYDFSPEGETYQKGDHVIVETARGIECGEVLNGCHEVPDNAVIQPLKPVQRRATAEDVARNEENRRKERDAREICLERIQRHKLEMKLIDVEYTFDNSKIMFYFTADGRVDFRDLVKDLASVFRTRIELRQIGVRDEAKMMGAIGTCGRELCCSTFLSEFHPVSIKMAKEQSLSLNPTKISGTCGRLMCCLKYENEAYEYLHKRSPRVDAIVSTPQGQGTVVAVNLLRECVRIRLDSETGNDLLECRVEDLEIIRDGGKRHGGDRATPRREAQPPKDNAGSERGERPERGDRPERGERPMRGDRAMHGDRPTRGDRAERGDRPMRGERPDQGEQTDQGERPERGDRRERGNRPERGNRHERGNRAEREANRSADDHTDAHSFREGGRSRDRRRDTDQQPGATLVEEAMDNSSMPQAQAVAVEQKDKPNPVNDWNDAIIEENGDHA